MAVYVVTHNSPVRYRIQGADEEEPILEIDDDKVQKYKREQDVIKLFAAKAIGFELEVRFKNIFLKEQPVLTQVVSAYDVQFDTKQHKITCLFEPKEHMYMAYNHQARYSS